MLIQVSEKLKRIVIPYRDDVRALFPHAINFIWEGEHLISIPHGTEETRMLRNLDIDASAPIQEYYHWTGYLPPFITQVKTCAMMTTNPRAFVLNRMGTGKTKAALWSFDYLRSVGEAHKMLVVAPLSTLSFTWVREVMTTVPHLTAQVLTGSAERRRKRLADMDADIYICNHDGVGTILNELRARGDIDCVVIDEAAVFRNARAERSKVMREIVRTRRWAWAMTGSPTPNSPTDAHGLVALMHPERKLSFRAFRDELMIQFATFKWLPRPDAASVVASYLQPSICFDLTDVVELPELVERTIDVQQGPKQTRAYQELRQQALTYLNEGVVTAQNGGVLYNKLVQVSCGYVYKDDRSYEVLDNDDRLDTMKELIEASDRKVIVFAPYIHCVKQMSIYLTKHKLTHFVVTGQTPQHERDRIFNAFQNGGGHEPLIAHPGCMAHGLNLTAADTIIWFAPVPSLETFEQANARITRVGQTHKQQVIMLSGTPVERLTYARLRTRRAVQAGILELLAEAVHE